MNDLSRLSPPRFPDVLMRTPINWTIVGFLAMLGGVHLAMALPAAFHGRWEGYLSFTCAGIFLAAAVMSGRFRTEIAFQTSRSQIRLRTGVGRWRVERFIPFDAVSAVKLTLTTPGSGRGRIDILSLIEEIECPPSRVPRQEALFLAMLIGVRLIKVEEEGTPGGRDSKPMQNSEIRNPE